MYSVCYAHQKLKRVWVPMLVVLQGIEDDEKVAIVDLGFEINTHKKECNHTTSFDYSLMA